MQTSSVFKRIHPFTISGSCLAVLGVGLWLFDQPLPALALLAVAYVFGLLEFKKYTSSYQFVLILASGLCLGTVLDLLVGTGPLFTMIMLICATVIIMRQIFMQTLTLVKFLWLEPTMMAIAWIMFGAVAIVHPFHWEAMGWPLVGLLPSTGLAMSYALDGRAIKRNVSQGYRIKIGNAAPDFELPDQYGRPVRLSDYLGRPVMLIFIRGDWCPGCHMMLRTYEKGRERFLERGVHVLGIGPDSIDVNKDMMERLGVDCRMLSDAGQRLSSQYGVVYSNPALAAMIQYEEGIPLPASFLVDKDGIVRYVSRPDRVGEFLDPSLIFGVLEKLPLVSAQTWKAA